MFFKWKDVTIEVLKDVKFETDLLITEYLRHLDDRFSTMIETVKKIEGRKELISYIRKSLLEEDEKEFSESIEKVRKEEIQDTRDDRIMLNKPDLIIISVTGGCLILIVWGISFLTLYWYMKQRRSVTFVPRSVRFSRLQDSPVSTPNPIKKNPTPILKKNEPVYVELTGAAETLV